MTPHFTASEATTTSSAKENIPSPAQWIRIQNTSCCMEVVRAVLGRKPITINSWFRSPAVNSSIGGASNSEHLEGAAVDFTCAGFGTPLDICRSLLSVAWVLNYNQLIYEGTWVHISFPPDGVKGKMEVLTRKSGKYLPGLVQ